VDQAVAIAVGGVPVRLRTSDPGFREQLVDRYRQFLAPASAADLEFEIQLTPPSAADPGIDVEARCHNGRWLFRRGDFQAEWDPVSGRGSTRHPPSPYAIDSILRILHSLLLANEGGFLVHAASAVRGDRAFLFSGLSGAGKTTISRLAPPDVSLLTDEISYVRRERAGYRAFGTPFAGELARVGENIAAPIAALYLLSQGKENRLDPIPRTEAVRLLMRNILFFAHEPPLVRRVFQAACDFVDKVPVQRLTFFPDQRVWELIR